MCLISIMRGCDMDLCPLYTMSSLLSSIFFYNITVLLQNKYVLVLLLAHIKFASAICDPLLSSQFPGISQCCSVVSKRWNWLRHLWITRYRGFLVVFFFGMAYSQFEWCIHLNSFSLLLLLLSVKLKVWEYERIKWK
jgi:hypothetical protein